MFKTFGSDFEPEIYQILELTPRDTEALAEDIEEDIQQFQSKINDGLDAGNRIIAYKDNGIGINIEGKDQWKKVIEREDPLESGTIHPRTIRLSQSEIIQKSLMIIYEKLNCQTVSIFLISKDGNLKREGLFGVDKEGEWVDNSWYPKESYSIGESFTGEAAKPSINSKHLKFGKTIIADEFSENILNHESHKKYINKFGSLNCGVAVPLNGPSRTFGVLRVLNKINCDSKESVGNCFFSENELSWLSLLTAYIASSLSTFRRDTRTQILQHLCRLQTKSFYDSSSLEEVLQQTLDLLVQNPDSPYMAGIIRTIDNEFKYLNIRAFSSVNLSGERDSQTIEIGKGLAGIVAATHRRLVIRNICEEQEIRKFRNKQWIIDNNFHSFGCFPLLSRGNVYGTLSLYTGYDYGFHNRGINNVQGISDLIAAIVYRFRRDIEFLAAAQQQLISSDPTLSDLLENQTILAMSGETKRDLDKLVRKSHMSYEEIFKASLALFALGLKAKEKGKKFGVIEPDQPTITNVVGLG